MILKFQETIRHLFPKKYFLKFFNLMVHQIMLVAALEVKKEETTINCFQKKQELL